jgi:hypothetical protein
MGIEVMKIKDLINKEIINEFSDTDPDVRAALEKQGYKLLGKGVDQSAFLEPKTGYVLKVFGTHSSTKGSGGIAISKSHKMFLTWAEYCMKHKDNKFLPRFYGFEKFVFKGHTYFQIRQERLTKIEGDLGFTLWDLSTYIKYNGFYLDNKDLLPGFRREESKSARTLQKRIGNKNLIQLLITVNELNTIAKQKGYNLDLHDENYMHRGNTPVIIDPWYLL